MNKTSNIETVKIIGNPSEAAMLRYVVDLSDAQMLRTRYEIVFEVCMHVGCALTDTAQVPFNSTRKYHLVIVKDSHMTNDTPTHLHYLLLMKGTLFPLQEAHPRALVSHNRPRACCRGNRVHMNSIFFLARKIVFAGAPEIIIKRCGKYAGEHGVEYPMDENYMESFDAAYAHFGEQVNQKYCETDMNTA